MFAATPCWFSRAGRRGPAGIGFKVLFGRPTWLLYLTNWRAYAAGSARWRIARRETDAIILKLNRPGGVTPPLECLLDLPARIRLNEHVQISASSGPSKLGAQNAFGPEFSLESLDPVWNNAREEVGLILPRFLEVFTKSI